MLCRTLSFTLIFILSSLVSSREYLVNQALPIDFEPVQISLSLYATAEGNNLLEMHVLPEGQWQLQEVSGEVLLLDAYVDTHLPLPLWAAVNRDGEGLVPRKQLLIISGVTIGGDIYSKTGYRFPDDSVQTSTTDTEGPDGGSVCTAGSNIRAILANGNVTCETDNVVTGSVTRIDTGAEVTSGPISTTVTVSVASIVGSMIQDDAVGSVDIADGSIGFTDINASHEQRRTSGECGIGQTITGINIDGSLNCGYRLMDYSNLDNYYFILDNEGNVGANTSISILAQDRLRNPLKSSKSQNNSYLATYHKH